MISRDLSGLRHFESLRPKQILSKGLQVLTLDGGRRRIQNTEHCLVCETSICRSYDGQFTLCFLNQSLMHCEHVLVMAARDSSSILSGVDVDLKLILSI